MATESEVQKQADKVAKLRERVASEQAKIAAATREADNDISMARLEREEEQLQAQLDSLKSQSSKTAIRATVKDQVETIKEGPGEAKLDDRAASAEKE